MDAIGPFVLAVLDLEDLVCRIDHRKRRLDLVARVGHEPPLLLIALHHRLEHDMGEHDDQQQNQQQARRADHQTHREGSPELRKVAPAIQQDVHASAVVAGCRRRIDHTEPVRIGKAAGAPLLRERLHQLTGLVIVHRGDAIGIGLAHRAVRVDDDREIAELEHHLDAQPVLGEIAFQLALAVLAGLFSRRIGHEPLAAGDIGEAPVGLLAHRQVARDVDGGDDGGKHQRDGRHRAHDESAPQALGESAALPPANHERTPSSGSSE